MKLKFKISCMELDGEQIAVPVGADSGFQGILKMNNTTRAIIDLLAEDTTEDAIVAALQQEYATDEATIRTSVRKVLATLQRENLLDC